MNTKETKLIVLRGPSGSGKSTTAKALRLAQTEKMALIEQDHFRRIVLKEKDIQNGLNADLIKRTVVFALEHSYHVILEGIFDAERYSNMFQELLDMHSTNNYFFYFDISFEETLRRHQSKPNKHEFGEKEMRDWYKEKDLLQFVQETLVPETSSSEQTINTLISTCNLKKII
jgi:predicted kinase